MRLIKIAARIVETARRVGSAFRGDAVRQPCPLSPTSRTVTAGARAAQSPDPVNHQRLPIYY
jgi:hypothetical protein